MSNVITTEQFRDVLPKSLRHRVSDKILDEINTAISDPDALDDFRDNILSYAGILQSNNGHFRLSSYINAVKFVSHVLIDNEDKPAFIKTFPDRYARFVKEGMTKKDIASRVGAYKRTKLVTEILRRTVVPIWLLNQRYIQEAINTQVEIMHTSESDKCRVDAANSILTHLKQPEVMESTLNISVNRGSVIEDYEAAMVRMVESQYELLENGADVHTIANAPIKKIQSDDDIVDI